MQDTHGQSSGPSESLLDLIRGTVHASDAPRHFASREEFEAWRDKFYEGFTWQYGDFWFNWVTREVGWEGFKDQLTIRQADVLRTLIEAVPQCVDTESLSRRCRELSGGGFEAENAKRNILKLRERLGEQSWRIQNWYRSGYRFLPFKED